LAAVEREFSEYRAAQRSTPEADLVRQLADSNEQVRRAEGKAEKAVAAKQGYKEQVCPHLSVCCQQSYKDNVFVSISTCVCLPTFGDSCSFDTCNMMLEPLRALVHILDVHLLDHKFDSL
jgi:hypothetical protein